MPCRSRARSRASGQAVRPQRLLHVVVSVKLAGLHLQAGARARASWAASWPSSRHRSRGRSTPRR
eukprot:7177644-Alexandrium_andersonii.AAC.1